MSAAHVGFFFHGQNPCISLLVNTIVVTICLAHRFIFIHSKPFHPFPANGGGPSALGGQFFHKIIFLRSKCLERCLCLANVSSTYEWHNQYSDFAYFHLPQILERDGKSMFTIFVAGVSLETVT